MMLLAVSEVLHGKHPIWNVWGGCPQRLLMVCCIKPGGHVTQFTHRFFLNGEEKLLYTTPDETITVV